MVVEKRLDLLLITETWHESSTSVSLKRVTPASFCCGDAARPLTTDTNIHTTHLVWRSSAQFPKNRNFGPDFDGTKFSTENRFTMGLHPCKLPVIVVVAPWKLYSE